jgi:hypothetical protein
MRWTLAIAGLMACAHAALAQSAASKVAPQKGWHTSLEAARAEARKTGKPLMVVFRCDP